MTPEAFERAREMNDMDALTRWLDRPPPRFTWTTARVETLRAMEIRERARQCRARRRTKVYCVAEADYDDD